MGSVYLKTKHAPWVDYKTFTSSGSALGNTEKKGANVPTDAYKVAELMNNTEVRISSDGVDGVQATAHFYGARWKTKQREEFDDISKIGSAALTCGEQIATNLYRYVDTIVLTDRWITEVHVADGRGSDGMSRVAWDTSGYDAIFVILVFGGSDNWKVDISGWSG